MKEMQNFNYIIIRIIISDLRKYCCQKSSSNIIEKCLDHSCIELQMLLIKEVIRDEDFIIELLVDLFGNYVIQKILLITMKIKKDIYFRLLHIIARNKDRLHKVPFGNKVLSKLKMSHKNLSQIIDSGMYNKPKNLPYVNSMIGNSLSSGMIFNFIPNPQENPNISKATYKANYPNKH